MLYRNVFDTLLVGTEMHDLPTFLVEALFANRDGRLSPGLFARVGVSGLGE